MSLERERERGPRSEKAAAELTFNVAAPSPDLTLTGDGEGVVVTRTDIGNVGG